MPALLKQGEGLDISCELRKFLPVGLMINGISASCQEQLYAFVLIAADRGDQGRAPVPLVRFFAGANTGERGVARRGSAASISRTRSGLARKTSAKMSKPKLAICREISLHYVQVTIVVVASEVLVVVVVEPTH
jgi:hypothetical protein